MTETLLFQNIKTTLANISKNLKFDTLSKFKKLSITAGKQAQSAV